MLAFRSAAVSVSLVAAKMEAKGQKRKAPKHEASSLNRVESHNGKDEPRKALVGKPVGKRQRVVGPGQTRAKGKRLANGKKNRRRDNNFVDADMDSKPSGLKESAELNDDADLVENEIQSPNASPGDQKRKSTNPLDSGRQKKRDDDEVIEEEKESKPSDVNTEGNDGAEEAGNGEKAEGASQDKKGKANDPRNDRTMFLGNVPVDVKQKSIRRLVSSHGEVDSIRTRNVVPEGPGIPKRAALLSGRVHEAVDVVSMYVVFANPGGKEAMENACAALNMSLFKGNHLRATPAERTEVCPRSSVFVGNIPFDISEEALLNAFLTALEGGDATIVAARVVRDKQTGIGRGFGFVSFSDELGARYCMSQKDNIRVGGRPIRLDMADKRNNTASKTYKRMNKNGGKRRKFGKKKGKRDSAKAT